MDPPKDDDGEGGKKKKKKQKRSEGPNAKNFGARLSVDKMKGANKFIIGWRLRLLGWLTQVIPKLFHCYHLSLVEFVE